ncbi:electron transfer flavoprotein subunit alpha/FixB family protein [Devosia sp. A16]|uniref:electron transfer flavoprotein subunit alpha/FixB family protein n=1 Tax=Devosia sp. A16 TaxID=1736675 RepID=UPI0006D84FED|nr:electron transfer flavoprotein subunit alpha/FixB family protein [Devosia sp. A16]
MAVLVLAEHDFGALSASTARIVAAAEQLGPVDLLVAGQGVEAVAAEAAKLAGVEKVLVADSAALSSLSPEPVAALLARLAEPYSHIVAAAAATGRDAIPRLAARLDLMPVTDVVAIHGPTRFDRPIYAGNAIETVSSGQAKQLLTIRASAFRPAASGNNAPINPVDADVAAVARFLAAHRTESDLPELSTAQVVVAGGVSFGSAEKFALVSELAKVLGAAVGATRAAVDAGYAPNDWQVGQTGKIIAPDLYIAIGISGALQHLAGIQGAKKIIAINKDPEAPLMKIADIALVGDLFEVVPELIAGLKR